MATKTYQIQINGIQESINALDAVIAKADELARKLAGGINVNVQPTVQPTAQQSVNNGQAQAAEKTFQIQAQVTTEIEKQNSALQEQTSLVNTQASSYKDALSVATSILGTYDENIAKLAEYDSKLKDIAAQKKAVQDIGVENDQTRAIMQDLISQEMKLKQLKSETTSIIKTETKLMQAEEGSYDQMAAAVARLRDAMRASNGNLSSEQFSAISSAVAELDKQLKDADKGMGQFFRNVGNYPSAAEGFNKIKVEIAGTTQEFDGAKTAIMTLKNAMAQLAVEGKTDTEEYKALADQMRNLQLAMVTVNDEIARSKDASSGLHDTIEMIQGFAAIGEISQGFANLFGIDDGAITEQIQKMTTLMGIIQGLNELKNQMVTGTGIGPVLNKLFDVTGLAPALKDLGDNVKLLAQKLGLVPPAAEAGAVGMTTFAVATKVATSAVKAFWRALVVGLVIEAVVWLIEGIVDGVKALYNIIHDYISLEDDVVASNTAMEHSFDLLKQSIEKYNEVRDHEVARGEIDKEIADMEKLLNLEDKLSKYANMSTGNILINAENADITPVLHQYSEFEERLAGINEKAQQGEEIGEDMGKVYNDVLADLAARWVEVDKNDKQAIEGFMEWYNQAPLYQAAVKWAIDTGDESMKNFGNSINNAMNNLGYFINQWYQLQAAAQSALNAANNTVDYYINYVDKYGKNAGAAQSRDKALAEVDKSNRSEEDKTKARKLINDEYNERTKAHAAGGRKVVNTVKKTNNDLARIEAQIWQDKLAIMRDGLNKTLTQLEYENRRRLEEINKAAVSEAKKEEARAAQKAKYEKQVIDAKKKADEEYLKAEEDFQRKLQQLRDETEKAALETKQAQEEINLSENIGVLTQMSLNVMFKPYYEDMKKLGELSMMINEELSRSELNVVKLTAQLQRLSDVINNTKDKDEIDKLAEQYDQLYKKLDEAKKYLEQMKATYNNYLHVSEQYGAYNKFPLDNPEERYVIWYEYYTNLFKLNKDSRMKNLELQKEINELEVKTQIDALEKQLKDEKKALNERYETRKDELDKLVEVEGDKYTKMYNAAMAHEATMTDDERSALLAQYDIYNNYYEERKNLEKKFNEDEFNLEEAYRSKESELWADNTVENSRLVAEFCEETKSLYSDMYNSILNEMSKFMSSIENKQQRLKTDNTDEWGFFNIKNFRNQRSKILSSYDHLSNFITQKMETLREDLAAGNISIGDFNNAYGELDELKAKIQDTMKELSSDNGMEDFIKGIDEWVQQIGQAANQVLSAVFDYRNSEFERMREQLDKQIELVEEKYNEMEELAQKHKDNMNEIEDELSTARGDRRQHLIDALSTEIDAQRQALAEQKKAEKEKEKLEQQGDKLELQRKKEQKRQNLITAVINAALAISQAAANKWPVPAIPLMALAATVGAAQVTAINAQKYAKGGLLEGPSHERGGIKVGGGIEVEGGEFVTNRRTTSQNLDLLYYINSSKKRLDISDFVEFYSKGASSRPLFGTKGKFEDGGLTPSLEIASRVAEVVVARDNRNIVVSVVDIINAENDLRRVQAMAGLGQ